MLLPFDMLDLGEDYILDEDKLYWTLYFTNDKNQPILICNQLFSVLQSLFKLIILLVKF